MGRFRAIITSINYNASKGFVDHQLSCIAGWRAVCDEVVVFNSEYEGFATKVNPTENPPTIRQMLEYADSSFGDDSVVAIVNSDITLLPKVVECIDIAEKKQFGRVWAAMSLRWEGNPPEVKGLGIDVFVITMPVIEHILKDCPSFMTLGRGLWDSWTNDWLRANIRDSNYFNMTEWKCVFHPDHERVPNRLSNYTDEQVAKILASGRLLSHGPPWKKYFKI